MKQDYSVLISDMSYDDEKHLVIRGFPRLELAHEFARRWVRDSVEELRGLNRMKEEVRGLRHTFGEDASVLGGEPPYAGSHELDYFIEHPATAEECDWKAIKRVAGIE